MANKPTVIDCSDDSFTSPKQKPEKTRTHDEWVVFFNEQVHMCRKSKGKRHEWGQEAKDRLVSRAKQHNIVLDGLA